jgi:hypothetical protein
MTPIFIFTVYICLWVTLQEFYEIHMHKNTI